MEFHKQNKFYKSTLYVFIIKLFGAGLAFFSQIIISKSIGIEDYGSLSIFLSIVNILILIPLIGMDTGIIRSVAASDNIAQKKWYLNATLVITSAMLFLIALLIIVSKNKFFDLFNLDPNLGLLLVLYVIVICYSKIFGGFLQGEKKTFTANFFSPFLNNLLKVLLLLLVFNFTNSLLTTIVVLLSVELLLVVIQIIYLAKSYIKVTSKPKEDVYDYIRYCIPLFFVASVGIVQISLGKFILSFMMGNYEVGILRIFENYSSILSLFVAPFVTMWPIMSEYYRHNRMDELKDLFKSSTIIISILILPAWITLTVCTTEIIGLFGVEANNIDNIKLIMFLFFLGTVYDAIVGPAGALLNMTRYSKINLYNNILLLILNIGLSLILIPRLGLMGAAIAFASSKIFINTLNVIQNKRLFNLFPYGKSHITLLIFCYPIYYLGTYINLKLSDETLLLNIVVVGICVYVLYIGLILVFNRKYVFMIFDQFKKKRSNNAL